ncbi:tellurium resistance TerZ family protein [Halomonas sp. CH40]
MAISLSKGQTISLAKNNDSGLSKVFMGLGWDPVQKKSGGFLSSLFGGGGGGDIDLDASVILLDSAKTPVDTVSFGQLVSKDGAIRHGGDNLTGAGEGDDEVIYVNLTDLPSNVMHLVFTVNSFRGQTFNEVENAFCRLVDEAKNEELCRYTLTDQGGHTGVIMASMTRTAEGWTMTAHGKPCSGRTVNDLAQDAVSVV